MMATSYKYKINFGGKKMFKKLLKNKKGFTLVELMVVVGILGVLTSIAIPVFNNVRGDSEKVACVATQRTLDSAYSMYRAAGGTKEADITLKDLVDGGYLAAIPECPTDGEYSFDGKLWHCDQHAR